LAKQYLERGLLVPDHVITRVMMTELEKRRAEHWLLDGECICVGKTQPPLKHRFAPDGFEKTKGASPGAAGSRWQGRWQLTACSSALRDSMRYAYFFVVNQELEEGIHQFEGAELKIRKSPSCVWVLSGGVNGPRSFWQQSKERNCFVAVASLSPKQQHVCVQLSSSCA